MAGLLYRRIGRETPVGAGFPAEVPRSREDG
jgi:hypothetical protein